LHPHPEKKPGVFPFGPVSIFSPFCLVPSPAKVHIPAMTANEHSSGARRRLLLGLVAGLILLAGLLWWTADWMETGPTPPRGGLWWPVRQELEVPHFLQHDPRWSGHLLGPTSGTLGGEGCAVASAAMVLAYYGLETDPGRLNAFLQRTPGGYTDRGWIYWEKAPLLDPVLAAAVLPHYEDDPSHALIDLNLLRGNPVIVRLRYPSGITHFMVIVGKKGYDYLVLDPGSGGERGVYPLREFGGPVEALRFYRPQRGLPGWAATSQEAAGS
jgi:hypothetical protein